MSETFVIVESGAALRDILMGFESSNYVTPPIVVVRENAICGVVAPDSGLWGAALQTPSVTIDEIAGKDYILARETDLLANVLERMKRRSKSMALVYGGAGAPRRDDVKGVITKQSIADAVI